MAEVQRQRNVVETVQVTILRHTHSCYFPLSLYRTRVASVKLGMVFHTIADQWRRLHWARGHVPPLLHMTGHGGDTVSRTTNKKLTKLY